MAKSFGRVPVMSMTKSKEIQRNWVGSCMSWPLAWQRLIQTSWEIFLLIHWASERLLPVYVHSAAIQNAWDPCIVIFSNNYKVVEPNFDLTETAAAQSYLRRPFLSSFFLDLRLIPTSWSHPVCNSSQNPPTLPVLLTPLGLIAP